MVEAAACLFVLLFSAGVFLFFRLLQRIYRVRPPVAKETSWLAALLAPPVKVEARPGRELEMEKRPPLPENGSGS